MNLSLSMSAYITLAIVWFVWCCLHSVLIAPNVITYVQHNHPRLSRYFRLLYNLGAVFTLFPVIAYSVYLRSTPFFTWDGTVRLIQVGMLLAASARTSVPMGSRMSCPRGIPAIAAFGDARRDSAVARVRCLRRDRPIDGMVGIPRDRGASDRD